MYDQMTKDKQVNGTGFGINKRSGVSFSRIARLALASAFVMLVLVLAAYQYKPAWSVDIGQIGDQPYVSNFNADEHAQFSYRWTKGESEIILPGVADGADRRVTINMSAWRPNGEKLPRVRVSAGGQRLAVFDATPEMNAYGFTLPGSTGMSGDIVLSLRTETFSPPNDGRNLGVMIDSVRAETVGGSFLPFSWPPLTVSVFAVLCAVLAALLVSTTGLSSNRALVALAATEALIAGGLIFQRLLLTPHLGWLATALAVGLVAVNTQRLGQWFISTNNELAVGKRAAIILAAFLVVFAVFGVALITSMDYIGHADYADNAVVARNIVQGNGMSVDYVAQFYIQYPDTIRHPVDTWPPLQPVLTVPAFFVAGVNVVAAKIPNLILSIILAIVIFWVGSRLFDRRAGLAAAILTAIHPYYVGMIAYPINDLVYSLLLLLFVFFLFMSADYTGGNWLMVNRLSEKRSRYLGFAGAGIWAGLLVLAKPSGAVLIVVSALFALALIWRTSGVRTAVTNLLVTAGAAFAVFLPWLIRNILQYGAVLYSTEQYDAWVLKYNPPWENIYNVYYGNLPHPRLLVGYGFDHLFQVIGDEFGRLARSIFEGPTFPGIAMLLAVLCLFVLQRRQRRFFWLLALNLAVTAVFICTYWHYEDRYFLFMIPWSYLVGMYFVFWLHDRIQEQGERLGGKRRITGFVVPVVFLLLAWPSVYTTSYDVSVYTSPTAIVAASNWLSDKTAEDAVVMTRNPWEVSFHSERKSVMIPNEDYNTIMQIADEYHASYLQLDHLADWQMRPELKELYQGQEVNGFKKVYDSQGILIYKFPD